MKLELSLIFSQIAAFLVMLFILRIVAWKPFLKLLSERKNKIESEFSDIDTRKEELKKREEEYQNKLATIDEEAHRRMQEALERSEALARDLMSEAQKGAKGALENARKAIEEEVASAQKKMKERLVNLVITASEKLLEEKVEGVADREKVAEFIDRIELQ